MDSFKDVKSWKVGVEAYISALRRQGQVYLYEIKVHMIYKESSRPSHFTQQDFINNNDNNIKEAGEMGQNSRALAALPDVLS